MNMGREVEEIKAKIDLAELIGSYVKLTQAGASFKALCPFHNEKTPSFIVTPSRNIWKCFGCGAGGDAFEFLMKIEGLEFSEALKILAQKAGVVLPTYNKKQESQKSRLYTICELTARYFNKILTDSSQAEGVREYIKRRGLSDEIVEDFQIGYAIDSWDNLINFLRQRGFNDQEIFLAGLTVKKEKGAGFYDRFRGRLMFPIIDLTGKTIGFGGRTLKKDDTAKYINTPQTLIYNKSLVLYGLNLAKQVIKEKDLCVLVEGYMDVIPSYQAGIKNVVSVSGTALTLEQIKILKRYSNNLALAFDMDLAGQNAASRSIELALAEEMNVKVIILDQEKDPGECAIKNPKAWKKVIKDAVPIMEFYLGQAVSGRDVNNPQDKKEIAKFLLDKINKLGSRVEQDHWIHEVAQKISVSENILREEIANMPNIETARPSIIRQEQSYGASHGVFTEKTLESAPINQPSSIDYVLFKQILILLLDYPQYIENVIDKLSVDYLSDNVASCLYKNLVLYYNKNKELFKKLTAKDSEDFDLFESFDGWCKNNKVEKLAVDLLTEVLLLSQSSEDDDLEERDVQNEISNSIKILKENYLKKRINLLKQELEKAEQTSPEKAKEILNELSELISQRT